MITLTDEIRNTDQRITWRLNRHFFFVKYNVQVSQTCFFKKRKTRDSSHKPD